MLKFRVRSPGSTQRKFLSGLLWGALYCFTGISAGAAFDPMHSPFHPASGVALAGLILTGWLALPGIILGILVEFWSYGLLNSTALSDSFNLSVRTMLTLGSQYAFSYWLLTIVLGKSFDFLTERSILWFLGISLLTSIAGPLLGLVPFHNSIFFNKEQALYMMAVHSIGHALGYVLVTPALLAICQNIKTGDMLPLARAITPLLVFFLTTGVWLYGYITLKKNILGHDLFGQSRAFTLLGNHSGVADSIASINAYVFIATAITSFIFVGWALGFSARRQRIEKLVSLRAQQFHTEVSERREIEDQLHRSMDMLESVNQGLSSFVIEGDKYKSLDELLLKIRDVSNSSEAILALTQTGDDNNQKLVARGTPGFPVTRNWSEPFMHLGSQWREYLGTKSPFTECLETQTIHIYNELGESGWNNGPTLIRCVAVVPICYQDKMLGMICMTNHPNSFTFSLINYLEPLMATVGVAVKSMLDQAEKDQLAQQIIQQATTDTLTQLPNRNALQKEIESMLRNRSAQGYIYAHLDLDHFDLINDHHGHQAGDHALRQFAGFIASKLEKGEQVYHFNGDKFALILKARGEARINQRLQKLLGSIRSFRFSWLDHILSLNASVGAVVLSTHDRNASTLFQHANSAFELAKSLGRNRYHIYSPREHRPASATDEMAALARINSALDQERFVVYAQPIMQTTSCHQEGPQMEALARMVGEDGSIILPGAFLPIMERFGLSTLLDIQIVNKCLACLKDCHRSGKPLPRVTINLSGQSLADPGFLEFLLGTIPLHGEFWSSLCFEITETQAISNLISAQNMIAKLKSRGCKFALDDFGSGLSSFSYLKDFDVDYLKIDGTFVIDICEDERNRAMVISIHEMAHALGMKTIAEFAETRAIIDALEETGVDFVQGIAIGEAMPFKECYDYIINTLPSAKRAFKAQ